MNQLSGVDGV
ncbi:unnamed protein product [Cuscuta epithymum]|uniref:Uncharacterized protein n=1 Tax=Cuscuta epithymum TaxID=186058 RepID=A0AAV0DXJ4_9ASTE|nr:unnamed protein product [Cuscuta epithymum]